VKAEKVRGHALQRTRPSRCGCHPRLPQAGSLGRSAKSNAGRFEQEAAEGTETDSILCFLGYLLLNSEAGHETDDFGVMTIGGAQTQSIVAVVEDLGSVHTNFVAVRPPLIEHELKSGESLRLGIRTMARKR